jgi:hypothetical protein
VTCDEPKLGSSSRFGNVSSQRSNHSWVVHRSVAFRTWFDTNYDSIRYRAVPAGTTGVAQPCAVGIQRPLKLAIKELQHGDIVSETVSQLAAGKIFYLGTKSSLRES